MSKNKPRLSQKRREQAKQIEFLNSIEYEVLEMFKYNMKRFVFHNVMCVGETYPNDTYLDDTYRNLGGTVNMATNGVPIEHDGMLYYACGCNIHDIGETRL